MQRENEKESERDREGGCDRGNDGVMISWVPVS